MPTAIWMGGPQDGAVIPVPKDVTWVTVLEDRAKKGVDTDGQPYRALVRYSVPIVDGKIIWAQRTEAPAEDK